MYSGRGHRSVQNVRRERLNVLPRNPPSCQRSPRKSDTLAISYRLSPWLETVSSPAAPALVKLWVVSLPEGSPKRTLHRLPRANSLDRGGSGDTLAGLKPIVEVINTVLCHDPNMTLVPSSASLRRSGSSRPAKSISSEISARHNLTSRQIAITRCQEPNPRMTELSNAQIKCTSMEINKLSEAESLEHVQRPPSFAGDQPSGSTRWASQFETRYRSLFSPLDFISCGLLG